ncbi:hypothetical protein LCGC14_2411680, partial [marine sediment metagenome]
NDTDFKYYENKIINKIIGNLNISSIKK